MSWGLIHIPKTGATGLEVETIKPNSSDVANVARQWVLDKEKGYDFDFDVDPEFSQKKATDIVPPSSTKQTSQPQSRHSPSGPSSQQKSQKPKKGHVEFRLRDTRSRHAPLPNQAPSNTRLNTHTIQPGNCAPGSVGFISPATVRANLCF